MHPLSPHRLETLSGRTPVQENTEYSLDLHIVFMIPGITAMSFAVYFSSLAPRPGEVPMSVVGWPRAVGYGHAGRR
jgi:hypothetical protein